MYGSSQRCHTATGTRMPHGITQCYLPPGRGDISALTPAEGVMGYRNVVLGNRRNNTVTNQWNVIQIKKRLECQIKSQPVKRTTPTRSRQQASWRSPGRQRRTYAHTDGCTTQQNNAFGHRQSLWGGLGGLTPKPLIMDNIFFQNGISTWHFTIYRDT